MNRNKKIIYIMVVLLAVIAGWLYFENSSGKEVRAMGFPSIRAVPDGFDYAEAKSIDTGDWCEVTTKTTAVGLCLWTAMCRVLLTQRFWKTMPVPKTRRRWATGRRWFIGT